MIENFRLKDLREDNFWTQEQVAQKLKIVRRTYAEYELKNNMIPINLLYDLAVLYQVSIQYLCGLTNYKDPYGEFMPYDKSKFLSNLKNLREQHGYTQAELGQKLSCGQDTISLYESGSRNIPIDILILLSKLYKIPIDYLLDVVK